MSWTPQDPSPVPVTDEAEAADEPGATDGAGSTDEVAALDGLEADLAAVEQALQRLDAVQGDPDADVVGSIAAAVPMARFDVQRPDQPA